MKAITVLKFLLGAVLGGGSAYVLTTPAPAPARVSAGDSEPAFVAPAVRPSHSELAPPAADPGTPSAAARLDALAMRARATPEQAFAEAMTIEPTRLRELALARVAGAWAAVDADRAFAALQRITDQMPRRAFGGALFATLVRTDPDAAMTHLRETDIDGALLAMDAVLELAKQDPDAVRSLIERTTDPAMRDFLQSRLVGAIAESDPLAAAALADSLPQASARQLYFEIGRRYAARDPEGAVAWAVARAADRTLLQTIVGQIASDDLARAVDIALSRPELPIQVDSLFNIARSSTGQSIVPDVVIQNVEQLPEIANRLLNSTNPRAQAAMGLLLEGWSIVDPDAALVWLIGRGPAVDTRHFAAIAAGYAQGDIRLTAETTDRLPPAARSEWIAEVAAAYAQRDPSAALEWLARYRTSPEYDAWISAAAQRALRNMPMSTDPTAAIRLLTSTTRPEPAAAAAVIQRWLQADAPAATDWALSLPPGAARNSALTEIVPRQIASGAIDSRIVSGFSDAASREAALARAVPALRDLASRNPAQARAIANAHYTTPDLRQRAQAAIDATPGR